MWNLLCQSEIALVLVVIYLVGGPFTRREEEIRFELFPPNYSTCCPWLELKLFFKLPISLLKEKKEDKNACFIQGFGISVLFLQLKISFSVVECCF